MNLSDLENLNEIFEYKDIWSHIIAYVGTIAIMRQRFFLVCKSACSLVMNPDLWYNYCRLRRLGFATQDEFAANKDKHDWYDEFKRHSLDAYKRRVAVESVMKGRNIFITGGAGVGKSHLFKEITKQLDAKGTLYAITSATGISAMAINGTTLHAWSGLGLFLDPVEKVIPRYANAKKEHLASQRVIKIWRKTQTLLIDEVSMINPFYFHKLDLFGRAMRGQKDKPFGGIQLILCGDFCQLESIKKDDEPRGWDYLFDLPNWTHLIDEVVYLTYSHRQQSDSSFFQMLSRIRLGIPTQKDMLKLSQRLFKQGEQLPDIPCLYAIKEDVNEINRRKLNEIIEEPKTYQMDVKFEGPVDPYKQQKMKEDIKKNSTFADVLELKKGCKVMLIRNLAIEQGLVNGARGVVVDFNSSSLPIVEFENKLRKTISPEKTEIEDKINATKVVITQIPLVLAYAITIHKSQGMSLESANMDLEKVFGSGQAYVALSRLRTLEGVHIIGRIPPNKFFANPKVVEFYNDLESKDIYLSTKREKKEFNLLNRKSVYPSKAELKERLERYKEEQQQKADLSSVFVVKSEGDIQKKIDDLIKKDVDVICITDSDSEQMEIENELGIEIKKMKHEA